MEKVKPLKFNFEPLYWNLGSIYQNTPSGQDSFESMTDGGNGSYSGHINSSQWKAVGSTKLNDCYSLGFVNRQEVDLIGLTMQSIALAPLGNATQRMETYALGYITDGQGRPIVHDVGGGNPPRNVGRAYVREYVMYTTQPLTDQTINDTLLATSGPVPPYLGEGNLDGAQLVAGYASTFTRDSSIPDLDGWCVKFQESKLGFGDIINAPTLYCTRVVVFEGRMVGRPTVNCSNGTVDAPVFLDIPHSTEVITVAELEPDTVEYFATMARSLQPPESNS